MREPGGQHQAGVHEDRLRDGDPAGRRDDGSARGGQKHEDPERAGNAAGEGNDGNQGSQGHQGFQGATGSGAQGAVGASGPQVIEGWYGQAYGKPLKRTREYIAVMRQIFGREKPVEFQGEYYQLPYKGPGSSGLGKPLRSILHGRTDIPIYTATISPKGESAW